MSSGYWPIAELHCYANHMLKRIFVGFAALLLAGAVLAQAYRWVDDNGLVHYSDKPHPGAEEIQLPGSRTNVVRQRPRTAPTTRSTSTRTSTANNDSMADAGPFQYESLAVASPAAEETKWNIGSVLDVSLDLQPGLQPGHQIRVYFDGEVRQTVTSTSFQLEEVWRGVHNIQVEVLDETGQMMIRSMPNRFYVQQTNIN